jgi:hypothetical protein
LFFGVLPVGEESSFFIFAIRSPSSFLDLFQAHVGFVDFSLGAALWFKAWWWIDASYSLTALGFRLEFSCSSPPPTRLLVDAHVRATVH